MQKLPHSLRTAQNDMHSMMIRLLVLYVLISKIFLSNGKYYSKSYFWDEPHQASGHLTSVFAENLSTLTF